MEERPAGKVTSTNTAVMDSPKKVSNPIGTQSQWSFGWQGNNKDVVNRPNNSKGNGSATQDSTSTTIRVASVSAIRKQGGRQNNPLKTPERRRKSPMQISPSGTTTLRLRARPL